jgi:hypothetical protein
MDTVTPNYAEPGAPTPCPMACQERYKKLCDDLPGRHIYIWACVCCQREYGPEWEEYHATWPGHPKAWPI